MSVWALKTETRYGKLPFALARLKVTVLGSVATAPPAGRTPLSPELPAFTRRSIVATTSADVKSLPSCHLTPLRRLKVQTLPVASGVHFSASPGTMLTSEPLGSAVHRNSNDAAVTPYEPRSCIPIGSSGPEGRCAATRMEPPCFPDV